MKVSDAFMHFKVSDGIRCVHAFSASISTSKLVVDIVPEVAAPSPVIFHYTIIDEIVI